MLALGWVLFAALYAIGLVYYIVTDWNAWRRQGISYPWWKVSRYKIAWPIMMLSDTLDTLRR